MNRFSLVFAVMVVSAATVAAGLVQGSMSRRWGETENEANAARLLEQLPERFGNWEMSDSFAGEERVLAMLQCAAYINRTYLNRTTGERVSLALIVGPVGPTAAHTPEICYSSKDYKMDGPKEVAQIEAGSVSGQFWVNHFTRTDVGQQKLTVYHAWNGKEGWRAAANPRWEFADRPFLYKIQIASSSSHSSEGDEIDTCKTFLEDLLPVAQEFLDK